MKESWSRSSSLSDSPSHGDNVNAVSVRPAPAPAKALSTPYPTQWSEADRPKDRPHTETVSTLATAPLTTPAAGVAPEEHGASTPSPKVEHTNLPHLPFVPSPDHNPAITGEIPFKADPSSILLSYPRTNVDHIHDFLSIYNPPESKFWKFTSSVVMSGVGAVSKTFLTFGSYSGVYNLNPFLNILCDPQRTRPILTVTNHTSTADDPLLWGVLPWKCYKDPSKTVRYALGAQELCYPNKFGQIVPIIRGNGVYQPAVDASINMLKSGKWVHIFPEGKINQTDQLIRLKWGVGRILMEYGGAPIKDGGKPLNELEMPIVIPIYHLGMEDILRLFPDNSSPVFPTLGLPLTIVFGEPVEFTSIMKEYKEGKIQEIEARVKMTERVFDAMEELKAVAIRLHMKHEAQAEEERIRRGFWWWTRPPGWGWWKTTDVPVHSKYRDQTVKIEEI